MIAIFFVLAVAGYVVFAAPGNVKIIKNYIISALLLTSLLALDICTGESIKITGITLCVIFTSRNE